MTDEPALPLKLLVMADVHLRAHRPLHGIDPASRLAHALTHARRHHPDAAALVLLGDLVHDGTEADYRRLAALLQDLPWPVHFLLGNHDDRTAFRTVFPEAPVDGAGFVQTAFPLGRHRLILLDSLEDPARLPRRHAGRLGSERLSFLSAGLEEAERAGARVLVFVHHPAVAIGIAEIDAIGLVDADAFLATLAPHRDRIDQLFFGHVHRVTAGSAAGLPFTTLASTTMQLPFHPPAGGPAHDPRLPAGYAVVLLPAADRAQPVIHHEMLPPAD